MSLFEFKVQEGEIKVSSAPAETVVHGRIYGFSVSRNSLENQLYVFMLYDISQDIIVATFVKDEKTQAYYSAAIQSIDTQIQKMNSQDTLFVPQTLVNC